MDEIPAVEIVSFVYFLRTSRRQLTTSISKQLPKAQLCAVTVAALARCQERRYRATALERRDVHVISEAELQADAGRPRNDGMCVDVVYAPFRLAGQT